MTFRPGESVTWLRPHHRGAPQAVPARVERDSGGTVVRVRIVVGGKRVVRHARREDLQPTTVDSES